jgi:hypothetical protein
VKLYQLGPERVVDVELAVAGLELAQRLKLVVSKCRELATIV